MVKVEIFFWQKLIQLLWWASHSLFLNFIHMNTIQKIGFTAVGFLATTASTFAAINAGESRVTTGLRGNEKPLDEAIMGYIGSAMAFLAIIGVCYGLYGWFLILTAGGDEEKVKKGRTILVQIATGLLVIALAYSLVKLVIGFLFSGTN